MKCMDEESFNPVSLSNLFMSFFAKNFNLVEKL